MTKQQQDCLVRAIEDESASRCMFDNRQYRWCITAAFYSAIWYIDSAIFPLTVTEKKKTVNYSDFGDFNRRYPNFPPGTTTHKKRGVAIGRIRGMSNLRSKFESLLTLSMATRYTKSGFSESDANDALKTLDEIKVICAAITPPVLPTQTTVVAPENVAKTAVGSSK